MSFNGTEFARISGSYSTAFIGSWSLLSQDTSSNKSTIRLYGTFYYGGGTKVSSSYSSGYFKVNGTQVGSGSYTRYPGYTQLGYKDITVTHNSDGSFPATSVSIAAYSYHFSATTKTATIAAGAVKAIPRASTVSATNATCGSTSTITVTPASSDFNHILYYSVGSISWKHIASLAKGTKSYSWTVPTDVEKQITSSTSGTVTVICETYNSSGTLLGSKSCNITATVRSSVAPTITGLTGAEAATIMTAKGWGIYVQNKSQIKLTASGVGGSQGSTITKVAFSGASQSSTGTATTWTTSQITVSGSQTFTCTVTDSRGRTASKTLSVTIQPYTAPVLKTFSAVRSDSSGTATDEGTAALVSSTITAAATCSGKNTTTRTAYYKLASASAWTELATLTSDSQTITSVEFSTDSTYDLKIEVVDGFNTIAQTIQLPTSYSMIEFRATKKGIALGKASEYDAFEVNMPTYPYDDITFCAGKQAEARRIKFLNDSSSTHPHNCILYGGNPASAVGIGCWDNANDRRIWTFHDTENLLSLGNPNGSVNCSGAITINTASVDPNYRYLLWRNANGVLRWSLTAQSEESGEGGVVLHQYDDSGGWKSYISASPDGSLNLYGKLNAKNIDCGSVTATAPSGGGTSAISVSFSKTFLTVPQVVAVAKTSVPANCHCGITGNSTTGFTLNFYRNSNTATTVSWIAIGA